MNLNESIQAVEAMTFLPESQRDAIIAQLRAADAKSVQSANVEALQSVRPDAVAGPGGVSAKQDSAALIAAAEYTPQEPTDAERQNPPLWAYTNFVAAGLDSPSAPNGPVERWGSALAAYGGAAAPSAQWVQTFKDVIRDYAAGSAMIDGAHAADIASALSAGALRDKPGIGFPIWDKAKVDQVLARFDSLAGNPEAQWATGQNASAATGSKGGMITMDEYIALQNRGWKVIDIANMLRKYD